MLAFKRDSPALGTPAPTCCDGSPIQIDCSEGIFRVNILGTNHKKKTANNDSEAVHSARRDGVTRRYSALLGYAFYQSRLSPDNWGVPRWKPDPLERWWRSRRAGPARWRGASVHCCRSWRLLACPPLSSQAPDGVVFGFFQLSKGRLNEPSA